MPHTLRRVDTGDETLTELGVLVGFDDDLAGEATRTSNRIRGLLTSIHPALERVLGPRVAHPAVLEILSRCGGPEGIRTKSPPISRRCSLIKLKRALFLSAFAALHDTASRTYYERKRAEGKKHNAALICLARLRCDVLYAMLKTKQPYRDRVRAEAA